MHSPRIIKDEKAVSKVIDVIGDLVNPFKDSSELLNIVNATVAPDKITADLMQAHRRGEDAYKQFRLQRLEANPPLKNFYDTLPKMKLKTFSETCKMKRVRSNGRDIMLRATTGLFGNILMMAQTRQLDMKEILKFPLGPLPWSLATADGLPRKTAKSTLSKELQKNVPASEFISLSSACIVDGMAIVHKVKGEKKTFGEIASLIFLKAVHEASNSTRLDIVFDVYNENSIKKCGTIFAAISIWKRRIQEHSIKTACSTVEKISYFHK